MTVLPKRVKKGWKWLGHIEEGRKGLKYDDSRGSTEQTHVVADDVNLRRTYRREQVYVCLFITVWYTVKSRYLEVDGAVLYKFKLPEVQINLHFG